MMEDLNMKSMKFLKFLFMSNWCTLKLRIPSTSISLHRKFVVGKGAEIVFFSGTQIL